MWQAWLNRCWQSAVCGRLRRLTGGSVTLHIGEETLRFTGAMWWTPDGFVSAPA